MTIWQFLVIRYQPFAILSGVVMIVVRWSF